MLDSVKVGFAMCGSFCTFKKAVEMLEVLKTSGAIITPIMSEVAYETDTRFGTAEGFREQIEQICQNKIIHTIKDAEPIGPKNLLDVLVIAPCTGNTLAKLANSIADTPVTLAAKAHLRNQKPIVISVSSNDALGANAKSIGMLLNNKEYYFVPMRLDDSINKPRSIVADMTLIPQTVEYAMAGKQIQPIYLTV